MYKCILYINKLAVILSKSKNLKKETYKQEIKEYSREIIWKHSIDNLTINREESKILNSKYINRLWDFAFEDSLIKHKIIKNADEKYLNDWNSFSDQTYSTKKPNELKVAYLCGPEPQNDLNHLIELGIRIENVYAFESEKTLYNQALNSLKDNYPTLKIFNGKIDHYLKSTLVKFDIVYLDFTSPLFSRESKPYQTIITLFENQSLSNLSSLIVNTCYPDKTQENVDFLTSFFHYQAFYDYLIYDSSDQDSKGRFMEDNFSAGIYEKDEFSPYVDKNFDFAYSAFQTSFIINYTNHILPITNVLKNPLLYKRLFTSNSDKINEEIKKFEENESTYIDPTNYSLYHFFSDLINGESNLEKSWKSFITKNDYNGYSMEMAIKFFYMQLNAPTEGFLNILSDSLKLSIPEIMKNIPDAINNMSRGLFCDVPMIHLWQELAINQLGYPYHNNTKSHKRFSYKAKERRMCVDIFTFDQCRSLYDWLPMVEYYGLDLKIIERQILTRICIDAIAKHSLHILQNQYFGAHIVCINDRTWSKNHYFENRENLE